MGTWDGIFVNLNSGLVLDLAGGVYEDHTLMQQYNFHGGWNQRWRRYGAGGGVGGQAYYLTPDFGPLANPPVKCLDVADASLEDGANIQLYPFTGQANQRFMLEPVGADPNLVRIVALHSNKCLDVEFQSQSQKAKVHQFHNNGQANQIWRYVDSNVLCS